MMALVVMCAALSTPCRQEGKSLASDFRIDAALMSIVIQGRIASNRIISRVLCSRGHCDSPRPGRPLAAAVRQALPGYLRVWT